MSLARASTNILWTRDYALSIQLLLLGCAAEAPVRSELGSHPPCTGRRGGLKLPRPAGRDLQGRTARRAHRPGGGPLSPEARERGERLLDNMQRTVREVMRGADG